MEKRMTWLCALIGGWLGSYLPSLLWDAGAISMSSLVCGGLGALVGVWIGFKITRL